MTLKEKFENVEIMFEGQMGSLKYDELYESSNQCEQIADKYAIEFAEWLRNKTAQVKGDRYKLFSDFEIYTINELLEIYKKQKQL